MPATFTAVRGQINDPAAVARVIAHADAVCCVRASFKNQGWTIVKPPRLTSGAAGGAVDVGVELRVGVLSSVSRADVAVFILGAIAQSQYREARVFIRR